MSKVKYINSFRKGWNEFIEYNTKERVKINIISSLVYLIVLILCIELSSFILNLKNINQNENIKLKYLIIFFSGLILILYTTILPFFIGISSSFFSNIIKFLGVIICSLIISMMLGSIYNLNLGRYYILLCFSGMILSLDAKYTYIRVKKMKREIK